jgi:type IX secretion system PorP/SprF family membrane protein
VLKRLRFSFVIILLVCQNIFCQQLPEYSQYMFNMYLINPAVAGTSDYYHLNAGYRNQYIGIPGAPTTIYFSGHGHVGKEHPRLRGIHMKQNSWHHGLGFLATADQMGGTNENKIFGNYKFQVTYSYDMTLAKDLRISFGASIGIQSIQINGQGGVFSNGTSPIVFNSVSNFVAPDLNAGIFLYHKLFYFGAASFQLIRHKYTYTPYAESTQGNYLERHYIFSGGLVLRLLRDPEIDMIPSVVLRVTENVKPAPFSVDFNVKITFKQLLWKDNHLIWGGFSWRTQDGLVFMMGCRFNKRFEIGYAYDLILSPLQRGTSGSHELMVGYRIVPNQRILSPSDFWN